MFPIMHLLDDAIPGYERHWAIDMMKNRKILNGGKLFLHSPVPLTQELRQTLSALGEVGAIVAPNRYHHLHVKAYIEKHPQAVVYAAPYESSGRLVRH